MTNLKRRRAALGGPWPRAVQQTREMARRKLDVNSARELFWLMHEQYEYLDGDRQANKAAECLKSMNELAKKHGMPHELDLIERRYGKGKSRNSGRLGIQHFALMKLP